MPHTSPDCVCVCMGEYGCVCTICVHASFHVCAASAGVSVLCVCRSLCCLLCLLRSNAVETLTQQTQPQAAWVRGGGVKIKKMAVSKETSLSVMNCMFKLYWSGMKFFMYIECLFHFGSFVFYIYVCDALRIIICIHGCILVH